MLVYTLLVQNFDVSTRWLAAIASLASILVRRRSAVKKMGDCQLANFSIDLLGSDAPFTVRAAYGDYVAEGRFLLDVRQSAWQTWLAQLTPPNLRPGQSTLAACGAELFEALLADDVRDLWLRARADLEAGRIDALRVRLQSASTAVADLPWETLYDADRGHTLAASTRTTLVRGVRWLRYVGGARPLQLTLPLRLLLAVPEDPTHQIDAAVEVARIEAALAPLHPDGVRWETLTGRFDALDLRQRLQAGGFDVLHLITHGTADGVLLWENDEAAITPAAALRAALESAPQVRLAVLNACETAIGAGAAPVTSVGAHLLQAGLPAVVAMQFPIADQAAAAFAEHFYGELLAGRCPGAVDVAVTQARAALYIRSPDDLAYATPVLWLNAPDGQIFVPDRAVRTRPRPSAPPDLTPLKAERASLEAWFAATPTADAAHIPALLRPMAASLAHELRECRDLFAQLDAIERQPLQPTLAAQYADKLARLRSSQETVNKLVQILQQPPDRAG